MYNITIIAGARPNFMKIAPIIHAMEQSKKEGVKIVERPFTVDEAKKSKEAFFTSSTSFLTPVVQIDDVIIGNGAPGLLTTKLLASYLRYVDCPKSNTLIS